MKKNLILLAFILSSCKINKSVSNFKIEYIPPNGFELENHIFIDKSEIAKISWKEYLFWLGKIFGKDSNEYLEAYPDTTVWQDEIYQDSFLINNYYSSFKFDDFPVVGVTQEQAMKFSKWRSDRVFEMLLIESGVIPILEQNSENYFTEERFFAGEVFDRKPQNGMYLVPKFTLPSVSDIELINSTIIEKNNSYIEKFRSKINKKCDNEAFLAISIENYSNNIELFNSPTRPTNIDCSNTSILEVHNLIGNVSEWTRNYLETFGGSWQDKIDSNKLIITKTDKHKSCTTGFRNICTVDIVKYYAL